MGDGLLVAVVAQNMAIMQLMLPNPAAVEEAAAVKQGRLRVKQVLG
jgi:hypothetical protein